MQTLTIEAASPESARQLRATLAAFRTEIRQSEDGRQSIRVELGRGDREIIDLLNALELYVTQRGAGPARINLDGHDYTLYAIPPEVSGSG
jgi:hypothetical protein